jgi:hypothetical protein
MSQETLFQVISNGKEREETCLHEENVGNVELPHVMLVAELH